MSRVLAAAAALALAACHPVVRPPAHRALTLTIIGTNDLHGALDRLPILAGYVANVRAARQADGGAVLLLDAGDMFQGTLESNLTEGQPVIAAYDAMGYAAAAVGNHEFDFGPVGPAMTAQSYSDDPRGALKARAAEARFPLLAANVVDAATGARVDWKNVAPSTLVDAGGVRVGVVGVTTEDTPVTTMPANFKGLAIAPPAEAIADQARKLRAAGAQVVVVVAHLGGVCTDLANPDDVASCDPNDEVMRVAPAIPHGLVDVIVAGHTHQGIANRIAGIPVIESYASGRAFGRVDLRVGADGSVTGARIYPPHDLCGGERPVPAAECRPGAYEGRPVVPSAAIARIIAPAFASAKQRREEPVGVVLATPIPRRFATESPEGNLFADLMLASHPEADAALTNGGGLRADLPAGPLEYGALFAACPFDNRLALVSLTGAQLRAIIADNLRATNGIFSIAGVTATATCRDGVLDIQLRDRKGLPIADDRRLRVATSDFLATGGDGALARLHLPAGATTMTDVLMRDAMAEVLKSRGGTVSADELYDPARPRLVYPGKRPVTCGAP